jgi:hypothetical protein
MSPLYPGTEDRLAPPPPPGEKAYLRPLPGGKKGGKGRGRSSFPEQETSCVPFPSRGAWASATTTALTGQRRHYFRYMASLMGPSRPERSSSTAGPRGIGRGAQQAVTRVAGLLVGLVQRLIRPQASGADNPVPRRRTAPSSAQAGRLPSTALGHGEQRHPGTVSCRRVRCRAGFGWGGEARGGRFPGYPRGAVPVVPSLVTTFSSYRRPCR